MKAWLTPLRLGLALAQGMLALPVFAAASQCPATIQETPSVQSPDAPWRVVAASGERPLEQVAIYLGPAELLGAQVPDSTRRDKTRETVAWQIVRQADDSFWVGCSYVGTTALLIKPLPASVKRCQVTYALLPNGKRQRVVSLDCQ